MLLKTKKAQKKCESKVLTPFNILMNIGSFCNAFPVLPEAITPSDILFKIIFASQI